MLLHNFIQKWLHVSEVPNVLIQISLLRRYMNYAKPSDSHHHIGAPPNMDTVDPNSVSSSLSFQGKNNPFIQVFWLTSFPPAWVHLFPAVAPALAVCHKLTSTTSHSRASQCSTSPSMYVAVLVDWFPDQVFFIPVLVLSIISRPLYGPFPRPFLDHSFGPIPRPFTFTVDFL